MYGPTRRLRVRLARDGLTVPSPLTLGETQAMNTTENILYIIGAGFSAPLGLPVMSNFISTSKDVYLRQKIDKKCFEAAFEAMKTLAGAKHFISTDLLNIEEVLCILEMEAYVRGESLSKHYADYIAETIDQSTPKPRYYREGSDLPSNWQRLIFGGDELMARYVSFVCNLFRMRISENENEFFHRRFDRVTDFSHNFRYGVISLNYDMVLENCIRFMNTAYRLPTSFDFTASSDANSTRNPYSPSSPDTVPLAKIHGSTQPRSITPPTWNKVTRTENQGVWKLAYQLLLNANQIRILGYSLPKSDTYFKYLLASALCNSFNVKEIDVICIDSDGDTQKRYYDLFERNRCRFKSANIVGYLNDVFERSVADYNQNERSLSCNKIEDAHKQTFTTTQQEP